MHWPKSVVLQTLKQGNGGQCHSDVTADISCAAVWRWERLSVGSLQVFENKAARAVTRKPWGTPTAVVLNQIGWLSIKQLTVYHQLISVYKIKRDHKPVYLSEKFRDKFNYKTRQATGNCIQVSKTPKKGTSKDSYVHKTTILWNKLPVKLRASQLPLLKFKMELKIWVKTNVQIWV